MDRLDAMSVLLTAVKLGSLTAAARELGQPLATVSRKVSRLEQHLNAQLLIRSTRKLELTDAGRSYVLACERILNEVQEAERAAAGEYSTPKGNLVMTAPVVFGRRHLLPVVTAFLQTHTAIDIRLLLADRLIHLQEEQIDLAVRIGHLPDSSLIAIPLGQVRLITCASPTYLQNHGEPTSAAQLRDHTLVSFDNISGFGNWRFGQDDRQLPEPRSRLIVTTAEAAIDAAVAGLGITRVLSYQVADARSADQLKRILSDLEPDPLPVHLVYTRQGPLPLKVRAFLDFAKPRLRTVMQQLESPES